MWRTRIAGILLGILWVCCAITACGANTAADPYAIIDPCGYFRLSLGGKTPAELTAAVPEFRQIWEDYYAIRSHAYVGYPGSVNAMFDENGTLVEFYYALRYSDETATLSEFIQVFQTLQAELSTHFSGGKAIVTNQLGELLLEEFTEQDLAAWYADPDCTHMAYLLYENGDVELCVNFLFGYFYVTFYS